MTTPAETRPSRRLARLAWAVAIVVLLAAMAMDTKVLTTEEAAASNPAAFDAKVYAAEEYPKIVEAVRTGAVQLPEVAAAVADDAQAAGEKYGKTAGTDKYAIPVTFTGEVTEADDNTLTVDVADMPEGTTVRVAIGSAVNGTAVRDVTGAYPFRDFANQTDHQQMANELKALVQQNVTRKIDPDAAEGAQASVTGIYVVGVGPQDSFLVTPVELEVSG